MKISKRAILVAGAGVAVVGLLAGCNVGADPTKGFGDAGLHQDNVQTITPGSHGQQNSPADIINFSDKYPNVEFKCNGVDGIYVNTRKDGFMVVIPNDPQCK